MSEAAVKAHVSRRLTMMDVTNRVHIALWSTTPRDEGRGAEPLGRDRLTAPQWRQVGDRPATARIPA